MIGAEVGALLQKREHARPLLGAVNLGERLAVAAKAIESHSPPVSCSQCQQFPVAQGPSPRGQEGGIG